MISFVSFSFLFYQMIVLGLLFCNIISINLFLTRQFEKQYL